MVDNYQGTFEGGDQTSPNPNDSPEGGGDSLDFGSAPPNARDNLGLPAAALHGGIDIRRSALARQLDPQFGDHPFEEGDGGQVFEHLLMLQKLDPVLAAYGDHVAAGANLDFQTHDILSAAMEGKTPGERLMDMQKARAAFIKQQNEMQVPVVNQDKSAALEQELADHFQNSPKVPILQSPSLSDSSKLMLLIHALTGGIHTLPADIQNMWAGTVANTDHANKLASDQYGLDRQQFGDKTNYLTHAISAEDKQNQQADVNNVRLFNAKRGMLKDQISEIDGQISGVQKEQTARLDHATKQFDELYHRGGTWTPQLDKQLHDFATSYAKDNGLKPEDVISMITHPNVNDKTSYQQKLEYGQRTMAWKALTQPYFNKGGITADDQKTLLAKQQEYAKLDNLSQDQADYAFPMPPIGRTQAGQKFDASQNMQKQTLALKIWHQALANQNQKGTYDPQNDPLNLAGLAQTLSGRSGLPIESFAMPAPGSSWQVIASQNAQNARQYSQAFDAFKFNTAQSDAATRDSIASWTKDHNDTYVKPFTQANSAWQKQQAALNNLKKSLATTTDPTKQSQIQDAIAQAAIAEQTARKTKDAAYKSMKDDEANRPSKKAIQTPFDVSDLPGGGQFSGGNGGPGSGKVEMSDRAKNDTVNPSLLSDLSGTGFKVYVGTANSGHSDLTVTGNPSRHKKGNAVDITAINGVPVTTPQGKALADQFVAKLEAQGYTRNTESGNDKAVLWQTNVGGNHFNHIHVSRNSNSGPSSQPKPGPDNPVATVQYSRPIGPRTTPKAPTVGSDGKIQTRSGNNPTVN